MNLPIILNLPYPKSINDYYHSKQGGGRYISAKGKAFKNQVIADYNKLQPIGDNVRMKVIIHPRQTKKGKEYKVCIDIDNGNKCILDSLNGIVYNDDKQVKDLHISYGVCKTGGGCTVIIDYFNQAECALLGKLNRGFE
jgi:crossover junction endodeoxyribonuclease RusA